MARRRGAAGKKGAAAGGGKRKGGGRSRSRGGDYNDDDDYDYYKDDDYVAEEEEDDESDSSGGASVDSTDEEGSFQFSSSEEEAKAKAKAKAKTRRRGKARKRPRVSDEEDEAVSLPRRKPGGNGSRGRRKSNPADLDDDDIDDEDFSPDEEEYEDEISPVVAKKNRSARNELGRKQRPKPNHGTRRRRRIGEVVSDSDDDFIVDAPARKRSKKNTKSKTTSRKTKASSRRRNDTSSESEFVLSDEDSAEKSRSDSEFLVYDDDSAGKGQSESDFAMSDDDFILSDREQHMKKSRVVGKKETPPTARKRKSSVDLDSSELKKVFKGGEGKEKEEEKGKEKLADVSEKQICGICLTEELKATVRGTLNCCAHYFCFACIIEWSKVESRCPVCKRRFVTISKSTSSDPGFGPRSAVVRVRKRDQVYQVSEEELMSLLDPYENVVCMVCQQGGYDHLMLLCDICDSPAHTYCVGLGADVPEGNWYCDGCRSVDDGPSDSHVQEDTVVEQGTDNSGLYAAGAEMEDFNTCMHSGTYTQCNQTSSQTIDLNVSPRHIPVEAGRTAPRGSNGWVSTRTGRRTPRQHRQVLQSDTRRQQTDSLLYRSSTSHNQDSTIGQATSSGNLFHGNTQSQDLGTDMQAIANFRLSASYPTQSASQRIDLNVSPRHLSEEDPGLASQTSGSGVSTVSGRRAIHRHIRILLSNSRLRQTNEPHCNAESDAITSRVDQGTGGLHASGTLNPIHGISAAEEHEQKKKHVMQVNANSASSLFSNGSGLRHVECAEEQVQSMVKDHLKNIFRDHGTIREIARRSTHTILAACGIEHNRRMVGTAVNPPEGCSHDSSDGPRDLVEGCCSSCFNSYVRDVVQKLIDTT